MRRQRHPQTARLRFHRERDRSHRRQIHEVGVDELHKLRGAHLDDLPASAGVQADALELAAARVQVHRQPAARPLRGGVDNRATQALLRATRLVGAREGLAIVRRRMETAAAS